MTATRTDAETMSVPSTGGIFLIEEKQSRKMPLFSLDYLHEIVFGCIQIIRSADSSRFDPSLLTRSWRMRRKRQDKHRDWLSVRMNSDGWDELGDRLEILWGPDYRGRYDLCFFKGERRGECFSEIPDDFPLPVFDKRKEVEALQCRRRVSQQLLTILSSIKTRILFLLPFSLSHTV